MGTPKLLLPWRGSTVIEHVLAAWQAAGVTRRVVVTHHDDIELAQLACAAGADVVTPPIPPPDMKASVWAALEYLIEREHPTPDDAWLLAPADMPRLDATVIRILLEAARQHPGAILVPTLQGQRGHPVLFRFSMAEAVRTLSEPEGVNQLLGRFPVMEVPVADQTILNDLDTPDDYEKLKEPERF